MKRQVKTDTDGDIRQIHERHEDRMALQQMELDCFEQEEAKAKSPRQWYMVANKAMQDAFGLPGEYWFEHYKVLIWFNGLDCALTFAYSGERERRADHREIMGYWPKRERGHAGERAVLHHLAHRSLGFNKPGEFVTVREILNGYPPFLIPGADVEGDTLKHSRLKAIREGGVIQARFVGHKTPLLFLNLPLWARLIREMLERTQEEYDQKRRWLYGRVQDQIPFHQHGRVKACQEALEKINSKWEAEIGCMDATAASLKCFRYLQQREKRFASLAQFAEELQAVRSGKIKVLK